MNGSWTVRVLVLISLACLVLGSVVHPTPTSTPEGLDASPDAEDVGSAGAEPEEEASFDQAPAEEEDDATLEPEAGAVTSRGVMYGLGFGLLGLLLFGSGVSGAVKVALLMALVTPLMARKAREDNLNRGRLLGFVEANAGIHFSAIKDALGLANGVMAHHLHALERDGAIISWRDGRMRRYAAAHVNPQSIPNIESPLVGTRLAILHALADAGALGLTTSELRERLHLSRQLLHHHMTHLSARTFVEKTSPNRRAPWRLTSEGVSALDV